MNLHTQQPATSYRRVATLIIPLLIIAAFPAPVAAQRAAFMINHQLNPLKSFVIASRTESHPYFVDIDADGDQDCFVGEYTHDGARFSKVYFFRNEGNRTNPNFKLVSGAANPLNEVVTNTLSIPYLIDIDLDGDYDCFVGEGNTGALLYYKNVGTPTQPSFEKQSAAFNPLNMVRYSASGVANPAFGDMDGDGDQDCVVADQAGLLNYYRNVGNATQPHFQHVTSSNDNPFAALAKSGGIYNLSLADWDKDGLMDLFINSAYFRNTGTKQKARFTSGTNEKDAPLLQNTGAARYSYIPLRLVDLNEDGIPEVFQGTAKGGFVYQTISNSKAVQIARAPSIGVSPNPSKSTFTLNLGSAGAASTIKIMDMQGKVISIRLTSSPELKFGNELQSGVYVVQVIQNNEVIYNQKIVKQQ